MTTLELRAHAGGRPRLRRRRRDPDDRARPRRRRRPVGRARGRPRADRPRRCGHRRADRRLRRPRAQARASGRASSRSRSPRTRPARSPTPSGSAGSPARPARSPGSTPSTTPRTSRSTWPSSAATSCSARPTSSAARTSGSRYLRAEVAETLAAVQGAAVLERAARTAVRDRDAALRAARRLPRDDRLPRLARRPRGPARLRARRSASSLLGGPPGRRRALRPRLRRAACRRSSSTSRASTRRPRRTRWPSAESASGTPTTGTASRSPTGFRRSSLRVGLIHYNTAAEVDRLLDELAARSGRPVDRFDAVIVGSGINSLACGALLARAGWSVCVLERNDWLGGAIQTAEITEPGFHHDVLLGLAPALGRRRRARAARRRPRRARPRVPEHRPTRPATVVPRRRGRLPAAHRRRERAPSSTATRRATAPRGSGCSTAFMPNADLAFGLLGTELWSTSGHGARRQGDPPARPARASPSSPATCSSRAATGSATRSPPSAIHGLLAPWVLHTGLGPDAAVVRLHDAGDRGRDPGGRHAGPARRRRAARRRARAADRGQRRHRAGRAPRSTRSSCATARATGVRTADGETVGAARAVIANVTPTQLYGPPARQPGRTRSPRRGGASATAAPRCRSTSRSPSRRAGTATSGSRRRRSST